MNISQADKIKLKTVYYFMMKFKDIKKDEVPNELGKLLWDLNLKLLSTDDLLEVEEREIEELVAMEVMAENDIENMDTIVHRKYKQKNMEF